MIACTANTQLIFDTHIQVNDALVCIRRGHKSILSFRVQHTYHINIHCTPVNPTMQRGGIVPNEKLVPTTPLANSEVSI